MAAKTKIRAAVLGASGYTGADMVRLAARHPYYGWEHNAGYATLTHRRGIEEHGITAFHRRSFARIKAVELGEQLELDLAALGIDGAERLLVPA